MELSRFKVMLVTSRPLIGYWKGDKGGNVLRDENGERIPTTKNDPNAVIEPVTPLDTRLERDQLIKAFQEANTPIDLCVLRHATTPLFREALRDGYDVLHFDGHGLPGFLLFESESGEAHSLPSDLFARLLRERGVQLVVLSACTSLEVARSLQDAGVPAVVGMQEQVRPETAAVFMRDFHATLTRGQTIRKAFEAGKDAIATHFGIQPTDENIPILLSTDDNRTFQIAGGGGFRLISQPLSSAGLPAKRPEFVGREAKIVEINKILGQERIMVLRGEGGIGKTAVAREVAAWQAGRDRYPGGVVWVDLEAGGTLANIQEEIGVGFFGEEFRRATGDRQALIREHVEEKPALLVLDNYDTVLQDATILRFVQELPGESRFLLTCRERVVTGKTIWVKELADKEARELFFGWARKNGWDGHQQGASVKDICILLGNMPLAIELIAPQAAELPLGRLKERIERGLHAIADDRPDLPRRQRSIEACLLISYDALTRESSKHLFARLSVFNDGAAQDAIPEVCAIQSWEDGAAELVRKGLVRFDKQRYTMHPLVRQYAKERLEEAGERLQYEERVMKYFLQLAYHVRYILYPGEDAQDASKTIELELKNMLAGQAWCIRQGNWHEAFRYAGALDDPLGAFGYWNDRVEVLHKGLHAAERIGNHEWMGIAHLSLGIVHQNMGNYPEARRFYGQSLKTARELENKGMMGSNFYHLGEVAEYQGEYPTAQDYYERCLQIERETQNPQWEVMTLNRLGDIAFYQDELDSARDYHKQALRLARQLKDRDGIGTSLHNLGNIYRQQRDYKRAEKYFRQALRRKQQVGHKTGKAAALGQLGDIALLQKDYTKAEQYLQQSYDTFTELGDQRSIAKVLGHLGELARSKEDWEAARDYYNQSLEHAIKLGDQELLGSLYFDYGKLSESLGQHEEALRFLLKSSLCFIVKLGRHESSVTWAIFEILEDKFGIDGTRFVEILKRLALEKNRLTDGEIIARIYEELRGRKHD
jgi:tetratricopeptide (TPR) repeat protein